MNKDLVKTLVGIAALAACAFAAVVYIISFVFKLYAFESIGPTIYENYRKNNYSLKITTEIGDEKRENTILYRKGVSKSITSNGVYVWNSNGKKYLVDEESKKYYDYDGDENSLGVADAGTFVNYTAGYYPSHFQRILAAIDPSIKVFLEKVDNTWCYRITTHQDGIKKIIYTSTSRKVPVKGIFKIDGGDTINYLFDLQFYIVSVRDVELPDFTDYTYVKDEESSERLVPADEPVVSNN